MTETIYTATMISRECSCGVVYAISEAFEKARRRDHKTFYCPNGCSRHFPQQTDEEVLRRQLEQAQRRAASAEGQATRAEYQRRAAVGQVTKIKKRVANGVCPCCQRTFRDLASHMADKHPDYAGEPQS